jgi:type IV secretion system protein VirB8
MIRFDTERSEGGGGPGMRQPWVASVKFSVSNKPINEQDRYLNPLGFQISSYRRDAETTQPVPMPAAPLPIVPAPAPVPTTGVSALPVPGSTVPGAPATPGAQAPAPVTPSAQPQSKSGNPNGEEFPAQ